MKRDAFVHHLSVALGEEARTVEEAVAQGLTRSSADVLKEAGFHQHRTCRPHTSAYDLARRAVEEIRGALSSVGAIVYATCIPANGNVGDVQAFQQTRDVKHLMVFPASRLQSDFDLTGAAVIGLNQQACTGMLGSLRVARALLAAEPELRRVLCVTADRFPDGALYEQSYNLISDGAAACVVSDEPTGWRLVACHAVTNGAMAGASDDETVGNYFSYTHRLIQDTLAKAALRIADIDWIVPQNMNVKAWQILARLLPFDLSRVYFKSIREAAHVISGDNVINLKRLTEEEHPPAGTRALLLMAGYGLNWQAVILERR